MAFDVAAVEALSIAAARVFADSFRDLALAAVEEVDAEHTRLAEEEQRLREVRGHISEMLEQLAVDREHFEEERRRFYNESTASNESGTENGRADRRRTLLNANRLPLEDLNIGSAVQGTVLNIGPLSAYVDIGAARDGKLRTCTCAKGGNFRLGQVVSVIIDSVDLTKQEVKLKTAADTDSIQQKADAHNGTNVVTLQELKIGAMVSGVVTSSSQGSIFLDLGASKIGRLRASRETRKLQEGDKVDVIVEGVDLERGQVGCTLASAKRLTSTSPIRRRSNSPSGREPLAARRSVLNASAPACQEGSFDEEVSSASRRRVPNKAAPKKRQPEVGRRKGSSPKSRVTRTRTALPRPDLCPIEQVVVGSEVAGVVNRCDQTGVYVDFGCIVGGHLLISEEEKDMFQLGDKVQGLVVEDVNLETSCVALRQPEALMGGYCYSP